MNKLRWLLALLALALGSCAKVETVDPTQVLLVVTSDLGSDVARYEVRVTDRTEQANGPTTTIYKTPPFTFALVPPAKSAAAVNLVIISAVDEFGDPIAVSKTLVSFVDRTSLQVNVRLSQACRGRICAAGLSCVESIAGSGECSDLQEAESIKIDPATKPGSEMMEGMTSGEDGGTGDGGGPGSGATPSGMASGMAGAAAGGSQAGASASGTSSPGGAVAGGTPAGGGSTLGGSTLDGGATMGGATMGGATMGGTIDAGVDAGPLPECDATRTCSTGYTCTGGKCVSRCAQTSCDPNATCSLNTSGAPVCTCNANYLSSTGTGGAVTCTRLQACTDLRCDTNATCEAASGAQPRCVCRPGYTGSGTTCAPVNCGALSIANGTVQTNGGTFNETAVYTCDPGYVKTGGTTRRCEASGMWSGTAPTCAARDCGTPSNPSYGRVTVTNGTRYPSGSVRYTCNPGFQLSGANTDTRTCTASGTWSGNAPTCLGCGDGIVSQALFEDCEPNASNAWTCIGCKRAEAYQPCDLNAECPGGLACTSGGYCTVGPCSSDAQCPATPAGPVRSSCMGMGFACTLAGCTANSQCPPGLSCSRPDGFCVLALQ